MAAWNENVSSGQISGEQRLSIPGLSGLHKLAYLDNWLEREPGAIASLREGSLDV